VTGLGNAKVIGIGTVQWTIIDDSGDKIPLTIYNCYHIPDIKIRLLSPQMFLRQFPRKSKGHFLGNDEYLCLSWGSRTKTVHYKLRNNLPIMYTAPSCKDLKCYLLERPRRETPELVIPEPPPKLQKVSEGDDIATRVIYSDALTGSQRLLLHWHRRMCHLDMRKIQDMARQGHLPRALANCDIPICPFCQYGKAHKRAAEKGRIVDKDKITQPGDLISMDQAISSLPGRHLTPSGNASSSKCTTISMFVDTVSKKVFVEFQKSTSSKETISAKKNVERLAHKEGVKFKHFRADNGVYRSKEFHAHIQSCNQTIDFCGVGAHHQNGVAERYIRTIIERARTALLQAHSKWPGAIDLELWPFAVQYAVDTWNDSPRKDLGWQTPNSVFANVKLTSDAIARRLKSYFPFGCPIYVLKASMQDGKKTTKWDYRSKQSIYLGKSKHHASSVILALNRKSDRITAQYHAVVDQDFSSIDNPKSLPEQWDKNLTENIWHSNFSIDHPPVEYDFEPANHTSKEGSDKLHPTLPDTHPLNNSGSSPDEDSRPSEGDDLIVTTQDTNKVSEGAQRERNKEANLAKANGNKNLRRARHILKQDSFNIATIASKFEHKTFSSNKKRKHRTVKHKQATHKHVFNIKHNNKPEEPEFIAKDNNGTSATTMIADLQRRESFCDNYLLDIQCLAYVAKNGNPNILTHRDAMKADDNDQFLVSMKEEIDNLLKNQIYEVVPIDTVPRNKTILDAVWSHRRKQKPDGTVYRHRSRICANGKQQVKGHDFQETFSPVVSWTTVRLLLILSNLLGLKTRQVDYVQAFPQAELEEDVYMKIPNGFYYEDPNNSNKKYCLKLKKNLYGLKQAAMNWYFKLRDGLLARGFKQSLIDPCLFIKDDIICLIYVDDTIFFAKNQEIIDDMISNLKKDFDLTDEGDVDAFLGVQFDYLEDGQIKMSQTGLIQQILKDVGIENDSKCHDTPAVTEPLKRHEDAQPFNASWEYRSVLGKLAYLAKNTRPDIEYAVHQCARYQNDPKIPHGNAVKRICRYLLKTKDKGITFKPSGNLTDITAYVDADFCGAYEKASSEDPNGCRSRTGFVIFYSGCPIIWVSKLQTEIALSTTEAEYIALSQSMRELLPLRELLIELSPVLKLPASSITTKCTVFEDNEGAKELANTAKYRPRTKHIAVKYHHFRSYVQKGLVQINSIDTKDQLADTFTKPLSKEQYEILRERIQGWLTVIKPLKEDMSLFLAALDNIYTADPRIEVL